jgi:Secretion system C-terminal sorting domain/Fibronectin type III domain
MKNFKLLLLLFALIFSKTIVAQTNCATPSVTASSTPNNLVGTANVTWATASYAVGTIYLIDYKLATATTWATVTATSSPFTLTGLLPCAAYELKMRAVCTPGTTNISAYSNVVSFTSNGVCATTCAAPTVTATATQTIVTPTSYGINAAWTNLNYPTGTTYTVSYKLSSATTWTDLTATTPQITIPNLVACSAYNVKVKANCSNTSSSAYSSIATVTTLGCAPACATPVLTVSTGNVASTLVLAWTTPNPYQTGTTFTVSYQKAGQNWQTTTASASPFTLTGLDSCSYYAVKIKANCSATTSSASSNVVTGVTACPISPCNAPGVQSYPDQNNGTLGNVAWSANNSATTTYLIEYKLATATTWTVATTSATTSPYQIAGLTACSDYQVRVKALCGGVASAYSNTSTFKTSGCPINVPCTAPFLTNTASSNNFVILNWMTANYPAGTTYTIQYTKSGTTNTQTVTVTSSPYTVANLDSCSIYQFKVKANCSATSSSTFSNIVVITTPCAPVCPPPAIQSYPDLTLNTVGYVVWSPSTTAQVNYTIEYKLVTATTWSIATNNAITSPYQLTGLTPCTEYQVRMKTNCSGTPSNYSNISTFKTSGCPTNTPCTPPILTASVTPANNVVLLSWTNNNYPTGTTFTIQYKKVNQTTVQTVTTNSTGYTLTNLDSCSVYEFKVKANCSATSSSVFSNVFVLTMPCAPPPAPCVAPGVQSYPSAASDSIGYVIWGGSYATTTTFIVEYKTTTATTWTVATSNTVNNPFELSNLVPCTEYQVRVKANCGNGLASAYSNISTFKTTGCPAVTCPAPIIQAYVNPALSAITGTVAWNIGFYAIGTTFSIEYKTLTGTSWTVATLNTTTNPYTITGLAPCTEYLVKMKANCPNNTVSTYSNTATFKTVGCVTCTPPTQFGVSNITNTTAQINWANIAGATGYTVQYRAINTSSWTTITTTTNTATLNGLVKCKFYYVRIATKCGNTTSNYSYTGIFKTKGCTTINDVFDNFVVAPNPSNGALNIAYNVAGASRINVDIFNIQGQVVRSLINEDKTEGVYEDNFDLSDLQSGLYLIVVRQGNGERAVKRWIKE